MVFNSLQYAIFLPLVVVGYFVLPQKYRWVLLLCASYYFYMSWEPRFVVLILFTTCTSYFASRCMGAPGAHSQKRRRAVLVAGVTCSLLCLFFFKYFNFFSENVTALLRAFSLPVGAFTLQVMLPVGISFYTFQTLSYVIDVYRGDLAPEKHFGIYALYVSFFPQLVAGPIERATNLLPQMYERHTFSTARTSRGLRMILWGLFKKVLVADTIAVYVNEVYNNVMGFSGLSLLAATLLFAVQIYCDFSGYSDVAIGSADILGFRLMENFRSPYFALSIKEFWRRWHISLSTWFSDYVYIPLGGSHVPKARHLANLLITFLLSGLWHGAAWTFVLWGLLHGLCLCGEVYLLPRREKRLTAAQSRAGRGLLRAWWWLLTMLLVLAGWVLFRANSMADAAWVFTHMLRGLNPTRLMEYLAPMGMQAGDVLRTALLLLVLFVYDWFNRDGGGLGRVAALPRFARYAAYYGLGFLLLWRIFTLPGDVAAEFIYFQF